MKRRLAIFSILFLPLLASAEPAKEPAKSKSTPAAKSSKVRFTTTLGDIVIELNSEKAPVTTENFLSYVNKKHYDGTAFHRVIDDFMIQGGGFSLTDGKLAEKSVGKGIINEGQNGLKNERGSIAMARTSDPNSATAQFFINVKDNPMLDYPSNGGYAVFGKVISGMEVVDKIKVVATRTAPLLMKHPVTNESIEAPAGDVPVDTILIKSASAE
jgi:peptidyl-prolyl cis-trans isomerase A (cyclophilin A)